MYNEQDNCPLDRYNGRTFKDLFIQVKSGLVCFQLFQLRWNFIIDIEVSLPRSTTVNTYVNDGNENFCNDYIP